MEEKRARRLWRRTVWARQRLGLTGTGLVLAMVVAGTVAAASVPATHVPGASNTGKTCADLFPGTSELKLDRGTSGTVSLGAFSVSVTIPSEDPAATSPNSLDFEANSATLVMGVIVKDGVDGANAYDYGPGGTQADTNLTTPFNGDKAISHVSFCVVPADEESPDPLDVEKTADGSYDRDITWTLDKSVDPTSHSGFPGDTFSSDWTVDATKTVDENDFLVSGEITVTNPNDFAVPFSLADSLDNGDAATIVCPGTGDSTGTAPANGSVTCDYSVAQTDATAVENTVEVTPGNPDVGGDTDTEAITWTANVTGDEETTLTDTEGPLDETLSDSGSFTYPGAFRCPLTTEVTYVNGLFSFTVTNEAELNGPNTDLDASATVTVNCQQRVQGETATVGGTQWPGTSNWFMYTACTTSKLDLIAGQHFDVGDIFIASCGGGGTTTITIVLDGARFANVKENLKIHPMNSAPTKYVQPGQFKHKFTVNPATFTVTVTVQKANFYGIHADVERFLP